MTPAIDHFRGPYGFLSNFHEATVSVRGEIYPSVEHAYQAAKTLNEAQRRQIQGATASEAKQLGKKVTMRPNWDSIRVEIMEDLVAQKFRNHPALKAKLLSTGDAELIEGNTWKDTFWGVYNGKGQNNLGKILMKVRRTLGGAAMKISEARPIPEDRPLPDGLGGCIIEPEVRDHPWVAVQKAQLALAIAVRSIQLDYGLTDDEVVAILAQEISSQVAWWQYLPERGRKK